MRWRVWLYRQDQIVTSTQGGGDVNTLEDVLSLPSLNCRSLFLGFNATEVNTGQPFSEVRHQILVIPSADKRHVVTYQAHEPASYVCTLILVCTISYENTFLSLAHYLELPCHLFGDHLHQFSASTWAVDCKFGNSHLSDLFSFHSYPWHTPSTDHQVNGPLSHTLDELSREPALVSLTR